MKYFEIDKNEQMLKEPEQLLLKRAIMREFVFQKNINRQHTSYYYKHIFERLLGFYISNTAFKLAMEELNIPSEEERGSSGRDLFYPVSTKSVKAAWDKSIYHRSVLLTRNIKK